MDSLWLAVDGASGCLKNVPGLIHRVIETEAWRERICRGTLYRHATFLSFITAMPLAGWGWHPERVEALLHLAFLPGRHSPITDGDLAALAEWRKAIGAGSEPSAALEQIRSLLPELTIADRVTLAAELMAGNRE